MTTNANAEAAEREREQHAFELGLATQCVQHREPECRRGRHAERDGDLAAWRVAQRWRSCASSMRRQTNNRTGIPSRSATIPSVIGPMRPSEKPPGSSGSDR